MNDETLHSADATLVDRFKQAWADNQRPDVQDYLPPESDPRYAATLEALTLIDIEFSRGETSALGATIGPYRLLEKLGEGGFGVVYLAEQTKPVKRRVALKVIKPGMDTSAVVARFAAERQVLALMDHESIARVLDAGATENGLPFFVMELVKGMPITQYCDQHRLTTGQRIELFMRVCRAIQHAHQKGIIHRDIKPSNVLVTSTDAKPLPKVIDFGIAKALGQAPTERTLFTQFGQVVGTVQYMSPEQATASAADVDTRSDVYCLGVLLYELLTGTTPIPSEDFRRAAFEEMRRMVREDTHPKPSTRISKLGDAMRGISENRQVPPRKLCTLIRGDLDWIVMKALEKDRTRRYESASALVDDLRRHLEDEPVLAGPPSVFYRFSKFTKKYRAAIVASAAIAALLIGATITSGLFFVRANKARSAEQTARKNAERAEAEAKQGAAAATAVTEFLADDVLSQADPGASPDRDIKLRTVLDLAAQKIDRRFEDEPAVEAAVRFAIGKSYLGLGEYEAAEVHLQESANLRYRIHGTDGEATLMSRSSLAGVYAALGRLDEAKRITDDTLRRREAVLGETHEETIWSMNDLAALNMELGQFAEAEALFDRALNLAGESLGSEHKVTQVITLHLSELYQTQGRFDEAEPLLRESLRTLEASLGAGHPMVVKSLTHLADLLTKKGQLAESETLLRRAISCGEQSLGPDHPLTLHAQNNLYELYAAQGRFAESEDLIRQILEVHRRVLGPEHYLTIFSMNNLATAHYRRGELAASAEGFRRTFELSQKVRGEEHPFTLQVMANLGSVYQALGRLDDAEAWQTRALEMRRRALGPEHPDTLVSMNNVATFYVSTGRYEEARELLEEVLDGYKRIVGQQHLTTLAITYNLARVYDKLGRLDDAEELYQQVLEFRQRTLGEQHPDTIILYNDLVVLTIDQGRLDQALQLSQKALEQNRHVMGDDHLGTLVAMNNRALSFHRLEAYDKAEPLYKQAIKKQQHALGEDHPASLRTRGNLGRMYFEQGRVDEAEPIHRDLWERRKRLLGKDHGDTQLALRELCATRLALDRVEEAESLARQAYQWAQKNARDDWALPQSQSLLGAALAGKRAFEEAEPLLLEGYRGLVARTENQPPYVQKRLTASAARRLVTLYEAWNKPAEAATWRQREK